MAGVSLRSEKAFSMLLILFFGIVRFLKCSFVPFGFVVVVDVASYPVLFFRGCFVD